MSFFEQQEQRINKQFISIFDSVSFISEHGKGTLQQAFDLVIGSFLKKQTYLLLITPHSVKAVYVCSSNEYLQYEPFITFESIIYELKECVDRKNIGTGNPIYKLGFAKKRFVEQLVNLNMQLDEQLIFNTESPDITDTEHVNESDEWAFYQGLPKEYDTLRAENEKIKAKYQDLWNKKEQPEAMYKLKEELLKRDDKEFKECQDKLDNSLLEVNSLNLHCNYLEQSLEQSKKKAELARQIAERKIAYLEYKLAHAELVETPTHNQKAEKQGDSLLILGAVMHCIKDAAKKNFTQDLLTQTILDRYKNVSGISKSTLDKKYSEAKSYLEQRHTP